MRKKKTYAMKRGGGVKPRMMKKGGKVEKDNVNLKGKRFIARGCGAVMSDSRKKTLYT